MAGLSITAADAVYMLAVENLYPVHQLLQGYSADAAFETDGSEPAEVVMGVDGRMSAGFVPFTTRQTINIMPDSPSSIIFEVWLQAQKAARAIYFGDGLIRLPAVQRSYKLTRGVLTTAPAIPGTRKVLQARGFVITWEDISPAPL